MMRNSRKGQITLFIIIGIILLIVVGIFIGLSSKQSEEAGESAVKDSIRQKNDVYTFAEECLRQTGVRALKRLGELGGFVDVRGLRFNKYNPTESEGIELSRSLQIPYWVQRLAPNKCENCKYFNFIRPLIDWELDLAKYTAEHVNECLEDFDIFVQQGYIFETEDPIIRFKVTEKEVIQTTVFPIKASIGDKSFEALEFAIKYDLNLRKFYDLAREIAEYEFFNQHLEKAALLGLSIYSGKPSSEKIPPIAWVDHNKEIVKWDYKAVKKRIQDSVLPSTINLIQVNNTRGFKKLSGGSLAAKAHYSDLVMNLKSPADSVRVKFLYSSEWKPYVDITPRAGNELIPNTYSTKYYFQLIPATQEIFYEFFYDVSFPVLVSLSDSEEFKSHSDDGYTFMFALEGNLLDNKDMREWNAGLGTTGAEDHSGNKFIISGVKKKAELCAQSVNPLSLAGSEFKCPNTGDVYSNEIECRANCLTDVPVVREYISEGTLFCDKTQRISGDNVLFTFDNYSKDPLEGVDVSYACSNFQACYLGKTNVDGILNAKLPLCLNGGQFIFSKRGYISEPIMGVSSGVDKSLDLEEPMFRLVEVPVTVRYINITNLFQYQRYLRPQVAQASLLFEIIIKAIEQNTAGPVAKLEPIAMQVMEIAVQIHKGIVSSMIPPGATSQESAQDLAVELEAKQDQLAAGAVSAILDMSAMYEDVVFTALQEIDLTEDYFSTGERDLLLDKFMKDKSVLELALKYLDTHADYGTITEADALMFRVFSQVLMLELELLADQNFIAEIDKTIGRSNWDKSIFMNPALDRDFSEDIVDIRRRLTNIHFLSPADLAQEDIIAEYKFKFRELEDYHQGIISINKNTKSESADGVPNPITQVKRDVPGELTFTLGEFFATLQLLSDNEIMIPERTVSTGGENISKIQAINVKAPAPAGGVLFSLNYSFTITDEIYDAKRIEFYVFQYDIPTVAEDLAELGKVRLYSEKFRAFVLPKLIK